LIALAGVVCRSIALAGVAEPLTSAAGKQAPNPSRHIFDLKSLASFQVCS